MKALLKPVQPTFQGAKPAALNPLRPVSLERPKTEVSPSPPVAPDTLLTKVGQGFSSVTNLLFSPLRRFQKFNTDRFDIQKFKLSLPNLGGAWEGKKILQLSDLHFYQFTTPAFCESLRKTIQTLQPDLIVFTGDLIHYGRKHLEKAQAFMNQLSAPLGKYACMGNHDYTDDTEGQAVKQALTGAGFNVLTNESTLLSQQGQPLCLSAPDDLMLGKPDIRQTVSQVPSNTPHICLSHNPDLADELSQSLHPPDLILSGHTHAGQFRSKFNWINGILDTLREKLVDFKLRYRDGWYTVNQSKLYVNRGVGSAWVAIRNRFLEFAMPPLRMNNAPELTVFELTAEKKSP